MNELEAKKRTEQVKDIMENMNYELLEITYLESKKELERRFKEDVGN